MGSDDSTFFDVAVAMIFAREFLEGFIILTQYRTIVTKSDLPAERKTQAYRTIWIYAGGAVALAVAMNLVVGIVLAALGNDLEKTPKRVIEGVSKIVASVCIAGLSLKLPKWLGVYKGKNKEMSFITKKLKQLLGLDSDEDGADILGLSRLRFDVAWNIWREVAEVGIFLVPFFLNGALKAVPLSAIVGILIAAVLGALLVLANRNLRNPRILAGFMAIVVGWLAVGLFTGGCHEFEEVLGETEDVFEFEPKEFWSHKKFPMALFKPFGYSQSPSVLQVTSFWLFAAVLVTLHSVKIFRTLKAAGTEDTKGKDAEAVAPAADTNPDVAEAKNPEIAV